MNAQQKRAWLGVITGIICIVGFFVLWPMTGPMLATTAFALFSVNGLAPLIGRKEKEDERDRAIRHRAALGGAMCSYGAFILGCMGTWGWSRVFGRPATIPVEVLPITALICGLFVLFFSHSLIVLALYGWHVEAEHA